MELSILIPARNEFFLAKTIEDIIANSEAETEIIVVLDGQWANPVIKQHPMVNVIYLPQSIGQRAATNVACKLARGKYVAKVDAHCSFEKGFDRKLIDGFKTTGDNVVMVPIMRNLWAFDWKCYQCGLRTYQGPTPKKCKECGSTDVRQKIVWLAKSGGTKSETHSSGRGPQSKSFCFDSTPHFQYFNEYTHTEKYKRDLEETGLTESMSLQGSFFMCTREKYWELNICDESFGSWGNQGIEVAAKFWLTGGKVIVNHKTWYAHLFRTQGGDFGFPYANPQSLVDIGKNKVKQEVFGCKIKNQVYPLSWLVERFWPVKGWTEQDLKNLKSGETITSRDLPIE
jgi:glycosyltransferase involved in cell wall biosynthesis